MGYMGSIAVSGRVYRTYGGYRGCLEGYMGHMGGIGVSGGVY